MDGEINAFFSKNFQTLIEQLEIAQLNVKIIVEYILKVETKDSFS